MCSKLLLVLINSIFYEPLKTLQQPIEKSGFWY